MSPFAYCRGNPVRLIDPDGRDEYVFKADGSYSHKEKQAGEHFGVLLGDKNRETIRFSFADTKNDVKQIEEGTINKVEYLPED